MHIAYLLTPPGIPLGGPSGSSRHVSALVQAFTTLGHRVSLCVARAVDHPPLPLLAEGGGRAPAAAERLRIHEFPPAPAPWWSRGRAALERRNALELAEQAVGWLRDDPPDLIYERYALFSDAGNSLREAFGVPWLLEVNAPLRLERARFEGLRSEGAARRAEKRTLRSADRLLAVSNPLARYLIDEVGASEERVMVVPNGVDLSRFYPRVRSPVLVHRYGLEGAPVVGFCGSLKPWHGLERWIQVLARARAQIPALRGLVVGEGPEGEGLRARVNAAGLSGVVVFTGQIESVDVPDHLALMDVMLAPYPRIDPFYFCPLKVQEALAAGVPVVTTAQGDLPALVGLAGVLVAPDPLDGMVEAVVKGLREPVLREAWSKAAPGQVAGRDWKAVAAEIVALAQRSARD